MIPPTTRRIDAGGVTLALHDWGGKGAPVLLAHATGLHGRVWAPVAQRLTDIGHHVWSFDFRGHGESDPSPSRRYDWEEFADDALAVVEHLGLTAEPSWSAAGHSKGAAALLLAEQRVAGTFPRLWCYEPIVIPSDAPLEPQPDFHLAESARRRRDVWPSRSEVLASYGSRPPFDALDPDALRAYVEHGLRSRDDGAVELACRPEDEATIYAMQFTHRAWLSLHAIGCPVLVVCGEHTDAIDARLAGMISGRIPRGRLEVMAGLGHFGPLQDPDRVVESMLAFDAAG